VLVVSAGAGGPGRGSRSGFGRRWSCRRRSRVGFSAALWAVAIHRELVGTGLDAGDLASAWAGARSPSRRRPTSIRPVLARTLRSLIQVLCVWVCHPWSPAEPEPRIDYAAVEDVLLRGALGVDPTGPAVRALPMDHTNARGDAVLLIASMPYHDLLAVQRQGRRLLRKSSCFVPKPAPGAGARSPRGPLTRRQHVTHGQPSLPAAQQAGPLWQFVNRVRAVCSSLSLAGLSVLMVLCSCRGSAVRS
jgi:hypothetical protein